MNNFKIKQGLFFLFIFMSIFLVACAEKKPNLAELKIVMPDQMIISNSVELKLTIDGEDYKWQSGEILWSVSDNKMASIKDGILTANSTGTVVVNIVFKNDSRFYASKTIKIVNPWVTDIVVTGPSEVEEQENIMLSAIVYPEMIDSEILWESSNEEILTVVSGKVYGRKAGIADVIVTCEDYEVKYSITVLPMSTELRIEGPDTIEVAQTTYLVTSVTDPIFSSSDETIIKIIDNSIVALKEGVVTISAYSNSYKDVQGTIEITVKPYQYNLDATAEELAAISLIIDNMTIEQMIGQLFMIDFYPTNSNRDYTTGLPSLRVSNNQTQTAVQYLQSTKIANYNIGSTIASDQDSLIKVSTTLHNMALDKSGVGAFVFAYHLDSNSTPAPFTSILSNMAIGASQKPKNAYKVANISGKQMLDYGINGTYSDYVDMSSLGTEYLSTSIFSKDSQKASLYGSHLIKGYKDNQVALVPIFGGNYTSLINNAPLQSLKNNELFMIRSAIQSGAEILALSSVQYTAIDSKPIFYSKEFVKNYIRRDMNYNGVIMTDINAFDASISYNNYSTYAKQAIENGIDLLSFRIYCSTWSTGYNVYNNAILQAYNSLVTAAENDSAFLLKVKESVNRIILTKYRQGIIKGTLPKSKQDYSSFDETIEMINRDSLTVVGNVPTLSTNKKAVFLSVSPTLTATAKTVVEFSTCLKSFFMKTEFRENAQYSIIHASETAHGSMLSSVMEYDYIYFLVPSMSTNPQIGVKNYKTSYSDFLDELYEIRPDAIAIILNSPNDYSYVSNFENFIYAYNYYDADFETILRYLNGEFTNNAKLPI